MSQFLSRRQLLQSTSLGSVALASMLQDRAFAAAVERAPDESPLSRASAALSSASETGDSFVHERWSIPNGHVRPQTRVESA